MELVADSISIFKGRQRVLKDISLQFSQGEFLALTGLNGAGKSTLLKTLTGLNKPDAGTVCIETNKVFSLSGIKRAALIGWLPQKYQLHEAISLQDFVASARYRFNESRKQALYAAKEAINEAGLNGMCLRLVTTLSGGELQRARFAALIAQETAFWLLDEPANHLDPASQFEMYRFIGEQWRKGKGILCVTHDVSMLASLDPQLLPEKIRIAGLNQGELAFNSLYFADSLAGSLQKLLRIEFKREPLLKSRRLIGSPLEMKAT